MLSLEEKFKTLTGETDNDKVSLFLENAESKILEVTNRPEMIDALMQSKLDLAVALYVRNGTEGESSHSEGGVNYSFVSPEDILKSARNYSLTPIARRLLDAKKQAENVSSSQEQITKE